MAQYYMYKSIVATIPELAKIFCCDKNVLEKLIKEVPLEDAIKRSPKVREHFDTYEQLEIATMTPQSMQIFVSKKHLVENFIANRCIKDEDLIQELYCTFICTCTRIVNINTENRTTYISIALRDRYISYMRDKYSKIADVQLMDPEKDYYYSFDNDLNMYRFVLPKIISDITNTLLNERQRFVIQSLYFECKSLQETAILLGVTLERVRQIKYDAERELRRSGRVSRLNDWLDIMQEYPDPIIVDITNK